MDNNIHQFLKFYWKSIVWALLIFIASAISGDELDKVKLINIPHFDKFVHFCLYFIFSLFLFAAQMKQKSISFLSYKEFLIGVSVAFLYSLLMEILQRFVFVARSFELFDLLANSAGILICVLLLILDLNFIKKTIRFL